MSIADQLKKLEKDPAFQKKIKEKRLAAMKNGQPFGKHINGAANEAEARVELNKVIDILESAVSRAVPGMYPPMFIITGPTVTVSGEYQFQLNFDPKDVHRDSLYPEGYPEGLNNIVLLYTRGAGPWKNAVWNTADGKKWNYPRHRFRAVYKNADGKSKYGHHVFVPKGYFIEGDPFLANAVDYLNRTLIDKGVRVILDPKYY